MGETGGKISFRGDFSKKGSTSAVENKRSAARGRAAANRDEAFRQVANVITLNGQSFARSAASRVGDILARFHDIDTYTRYDLVDEAEGLNDILNLNPGMLAGAQVFYAESGNLFSIELFNELATPILERLVETNSLTPIGSTVAAHSDPNVYRLALLRYIVRLGRSRGVAGLPDQ